MLITFYDGIVKTTTTTTTNNKDNNSSSRHTQKVAGVKELMAFIISMWFIAPSVSKVSV